MEITCPRCRSRHRVDPPAPTRARTRPWQFRCSECGNRFPIEGDAAALPPAMLPIEPPSRLSPEPRVVSPGEPVEMLRVGGNVYSVPDIAVLQRWILEGRVTTGDMVSQHGMRWTPLGERSDLAVFFQAAQALTVAGGGGNPPPASRFSDAGLPLAENEQLYVEEVNPGDPDGPPTLFIGQLPPSDEAPTLRELPSEETADIPASSLPLSEQDTLHLGTLPYEEDPPTRMEDPEPVDELPPELLGARPRFLDDPDALLRMPPMPAFHAEAGALGFSLGPDPDTQEATIEETRLLESQASQAAEDEFMRTGVLPLPAEPLVPPPIRVEGRIPRTVAPAAPRSVLDDEVFEAPKPRQGFGLEFVMGGLFLLACAVAGVGYLLQPKPEAAPEVAMAAAPAVEVPAAERTPEPAPGAEPEAPVPAEHAEEVAPEPVEVPPAPAVEAPRPAPPPSPKPAPAPKPAPKPAVAQAERAPVPPKAEGGSARQLTDQGWAALDRGDAEAAHGLFARALQKSGTYAPALNGRGYANEKLGDKVSARADYCAALENAGTDTDLTRELTGNLRRIGAGCAPH